MVDTHCEKCERKFRSVQGLRNHQRRKISCNINLTCAHCSKKFKTQKDYIQHNNRKTSCRPKNSHSIEDEIKFLETKYKLELDKELEILKKKNENDLDILEKRKEFIIAQKEKELAVNEMKKLSKQNSSSIAIYIISNDDHIEKNKYKIGRTSDDEKHLETKYQRYLCGAKVLLYHETSTAADAETNILTYFKEKRQTTPTGGLNEWICEEFNTIKNYIDENIINPIS